MRWVVFGVQRGNFGQRVESFRLPLVTQDLKDLVASASEGNKNINNFECSVFDGNYVTGDISSDYLQRLDAMRNDSAKTQSEFKFEPQKEQVIGIHNEFSR